MRPGLGGADSVSVLPHPLAVGLPGGLARRLARNGQLVLLRESHLGFVDDPAAGAGGFEALTKALCEKGWALFQEIEAKGGLPAALADGGFQRQVAENAAALRRDVARIKTPITGVSAHPKLVEAPIDVRARRAGAAAFAAAEGALAPVPPRRGVRGVARPFGRALANERRPAEGLSGGDRARARASRPRRLHARLARGGRHRARL